MKGTKILQQTALYLKRHSPEILTIIGAVGVVATAVLTAKATREAGFIIEEEQLNKSHVCDNEKLTKSELVMAVGPAYIPAVLTGVASIACIVGANIMNQRQQAALTSAYIFLDRSFKEYKQTVIDMYGENADRDVKTTIAKAKYKTTELPSDGETLLFYEEHYGDYFERKLVEVMDAEYQLNRKFAFEGEVSLNDFFEFLGLNNTQVGDILGWSQEEICDYTHPAWIEFEHQLVRMDDGMECYIINMLTTPIAGYDCPF